MTPTASIPPTPPVPLELTDAAGHVWRPQADAHFMSGCDDTFGIRILDLVRQSPEVLIRRLTTDPKVHAGVLWLAVESQARAESVGGAAFARLLVARSCALYGAMMKAILWRIAEQFPGSLYGRTVLANPALIAKV